MTSRNSAIARTSRAVFLGGSMLKFRVFVEKDEPGWVSSLANQIAEFVNAQQVEVVAIVNAAHQILILWYR